MTKKRTHPKATTASVRRVAAEHGIHIGYTNSSRNRDCVIPRQVKNSDGTISHVELQFHYRNQNQREQVRQRLLAVLAEHFDVETTSITWVRTKGTAPQAPVAEAPAEKAVKHLAVPSEGVEVRVTDTQPMDVFPTPWSVKEPDAPAAMTVDIPGAFDNWFEGGSIGQGIYDEPAAEKLGAAYTSATTIRRGKGYSVRLTTTSIEALWLLVETADSATWFDEPEDRSLVAAARTVIERGHQAMSPYYAQRYPVGSTVTAKDGTTGTVTGMSFTSTAACLAVQTDSGTAWIDDDKITSVAA